MSNPTAYEVEKMDLVLDSDGVEVRRAPAGESMTLLRISCPAGFDFGPALKGLPHDMCCCEHWGQIVKGSMNISTHDGQSLALAEGQAFHLLPGHAPDFPEDCTWIEFTPTDQVERLLSHMGLA